MKMRWWIGFVVLLLVGAGSAAAQTGTGGLEVVRQEHSYAFNEELVFELEANSQEPVPADSVELLYSVGHDSDVVNRRQPDYEPGQQLAVRVRDELTQGQIPPTSAIQYHWEVTDAAGNTFETETKSFVYMDDRFDWRTVSDGALTVYYYGRTDADALLRAAAAALQRIETTLGHAVGMPLKIVVYATRGDMQAALSPRGATFDEQITTLGTVVAPDVMLLLGGDERVYNTIGHELTHMVVGEATDNPFADIPAWLNEGLAMYHQDAIEPVYPQVLREAVRANDLDTVRRLSGRTGNAARVNLWYAEVWSVVDFLIKEYGEDRMGQVLDIFAAGANPDDALMEVYGFDRDGLTARWWESLGVEVPAALQSEGTAAPSDAAPSLPETTVEESAGAAPAASEATKEAPAAAEPVREPAAQPAGPLACCIGLLPLGLILLGALQFRRRTA
jgi:hypothetical protein